MGAIENMGTHAKDIGQQDQQPAPQNQWTGTSIGHSQIQTRKFNRFNKDFSISGCLGQQ
ncbi:MAG: hypothetical protein QUT30_15780 [Acidobacteriota bacterium]|jgi:hypothetical protein|nr:hypothetical protein [Acidobacteriota bacterium]